MVIFILRRILLPTAYSDFLVKPEYGLMSTKAGRLGALQQELFQLLLVLGTQLTAPTRMRFGFHRLPTRYRGRSGLNQTSYFVDAFTYIKQLSRPLTTIFQPFGTTFRSHINEYKLFL